MTHLAQPPSRPRKCRLGACAACVACASDTARSSNPFADFGDDDEPQAGDVPGLASCAMMTSSRATAIFLNPFA